MPEDLREILQVFSNAISITCAGDYSAQQLEAWASGSAYTDRWIAKMRSQYFVLAIVANQVAGFASLENDHHVDFLFVEPGHQHQGIATALLHQLEEESRRRRQTRMTTNASITARPFFEQRGFTVLEQQQVTIGSVQLTNFRMEKRLTQMG